MLTQAGTSPAPCKHSCKRDADLQTTPCEQAFSMSADGPVSAYVNPGGVVHETATYYKAKNIVLIGAPSTEHSWFPGCPPETP